jgi:hypothetical protein
MLTAFINLKMMSEVPHDNWKRLKLFEDAGMIAWLVFNANFSSVSAVWWCKQILYTKFLIYKILQNKTYLCIIESCFMYK